MAAKTPVPDYPRRPDSRHRWTLVLALRLERLHRKRLTPWPSCVAFTGIRSTPSFVAAGNGPHRTRKIYARIFRPPAGPAVSGKSSIGRRESSAPFCLSRWKNTWPMSPIASRPKNAAGGRPTSSVDSLAAESRYGWSRRTI